MIVEDDPSQRQMISLLVKRKLEMASVSAENGLVALALLRGDTENNIHLIILDLHMPEMDGMEFLEIVSQQYPKLPVIMLTGTNDMDMAVKAMKIGACDFLRKPVEPDRFQVSVHNAMKLRVLEKEVTRLKHKDEGTFTFEDLIGHDDGLSSVINMGRKAASADIPVLLTGETGVGKEVFAQAIHGESSRVGRPFVAINCGAIPKNLVESTLFGHEKGAFTGAISKAPGCFREAEGGTVFLDEIGDLPLDAQVKLLRVLQQKEIRPVGADKSVLVNVRIISATNRDLEMDVAEKRFRDDLYFRLNVLPIHLPALRERTQDIPALAHHFIERFSASEGRPLKDITTAAKQILSGWEWAGNVRELENTIHRAMVLCEKDSLDCDDLTTLPTSVFSSLNNPISLSGENSIAMFEAGGRIKTMDQLELDAMQFALKHHNNNITQAALSLDMAKSTFYRKLKAKD